jgi:hypothetical protein
MGDPRERGAHRRPLSQRGAADGQEPALQVPLQHGWPWSQGAPGWAHWQEHVEPPLHGTRKLFASGVRQARPLQQDALVVQA